MEFIDQLIDYLINCGSITRHGCFNSFNKISMIFIKEFRTYAGRNYFNIINIILIKDLVHMLGTGT